MTTCDVCKRPLWKAADGRRNDEEWCFDRPNLTCRMIAMGYQRGLLDGRREMLNAVCETLAEEGHGQPVDRVLIDIMLFSVTEAKKEAPM